MTPFTTRPELVGTIGMAAASHWLAAQTAMSVLERGGNAFDAAVAGGFVLEVVEPHQSGLGGEAPMIVYSASEDAVHVVDGQGPAPAAATAARFAGLGLDLVPGVGLLAACVPAAFGAWMLLLDRFGTMSLREVLDPAIGYAEGGFPVHATLEATLAAVEGDMLRDWPSSAEIWLASGVPAAGSRLRNERYATTLRRLLAEGEAAGGERSAQIEAARKAFYEGFVADEIDRFCAGSGLLTGEDLAGWRCSLESPVRLGFREFEVCKTAPFGQGPVFLQQLALLGGFDLEGLGAGSPDLVHVVVECSKLAFADREAYYGDPRHVDVPVDELLSPSYAAERRRLVTETASTELRPGSPGGRLPRLPARLGLEGVPARGAATAGVSDLAPPLDPRLGPPPGSRRAMRGDTCHLDVADRHGNLVSATPSGGWLQSSPAVGGLGVCLGTRAQMFWLEEGLPASLAPGKRPRTTLSPGLAFRDGEPYLAFGTPGGDQQDQWTLLAFLNHAVFGMDLQAAIDLPTWHSNHAPSSFFPREAYPNQLVAETGLGTACLAELRRRGHDVVEAPFALGRMTAVARSGDGFLRGAADPRGMQAYAAGR